MPDFRFISTKTTTQPSSGYASRISSKAWSQYESLIRRLYDCGSTRDDIQRTLASEHGFQPSIGQLRDQMVRWGLKSSRKSKNRSGSDREEISSGSLTVSDGLHEPLLKFHSPSPVQIYTVLPDDSFASMWPRFDMGLMPYNIAIEMEVLADTLFLGGRYIAAFNLYFSIYHAISCTFRFGNFDLVAAARFRALVGCLRSSANSEQRSQVVSIAEQELKHSSVKHYCELSDVDLHDRQGLPPGPLMAHFHDRETFRHALAVTENASTMNDVVRKLQVEDGKAEVLGWCFERLNTSDFILTYNQQVLEVGNGVGCRTYNISQSTIYWYLIVNVMDGSGSDPPRFTIRHISGQRYTFSVCETFAIIATMVSSEPWLFSLDQLPAGSLKRWTETLSHDDAIFETTFQHAIQTTMVPNCEKRLAKTNLDALATTSGYPAYRMPNTSFLRSLTSRLSETQAMPARVSRSPNEMEIDVAHIADLDLLEFKNLLREYSNVVRSYVNENCAYGTSYQLRERPREPTSGNSSASSTKFRPNRLLADRPHLIGSSDPTLKGGSTGSSFRSFQSTHVRSKKILAQLPELDPMSLDISDSSNFNRQFPLPVGVR